MVARYGGIINATHMRGEGDTVLDSIREAIEIGEKARAPVEIFHLKVAGSNNWGRMPEVVALIESARARGRDITANQYPYIAAYHPTLPLLPPWALEGGVDKTMERLSHPQLRTRMKRDISEGLQGWTSNYVRLSGGWQHIVIGATRTSKNASLPGKTLEDNGKLRGQDPADAFFDLLLEEHGQVSCMPFMMLYGNRTSRRCCEHHGLPLRRTGQSLAIEGSAGRSASPSPELRYLPAHPRALRAAGRMLGHMGGWCSKNDFALRATLGNLTHGGLPREGFWADIVCLLPGLHQGYSHLREAETISPGY